MPPPAVVDCENPEAQTHFPPTFGTWLGGQVLLVGRNVGSDVTVGLTVGDVLWQTLLAPEPIAVEPGGQEHDVDWTAETAPGKQGMHDKEPIILNVFTGQGAQKTGEPRTALLRKPPIHRQAPSTLMLFAGHVRGGGVVGPRVGTTVGIADGIRVGAPIVERWQTREVPVPIGTNPLLHVHEAGPPDAKELGGHATHIFITSLSHTKPIGTVDCNALGASLGVQ